MLILMGSAVRSSQSWTHPEPPGRPKLSQESLKHNRCVSDSLGLCFRPTQTLPPQSSVVCCHLVDDTQNITRTHWRPLTISMAEPAKGIHKVFCLSLDTFEASEAFFLKGRLRHQTIVGNQPVVQCNLGSDCCCCLSNWAINSPSVSDNIMKYIQRVYTVSVPGLWISEWVYFDFCVYLEVNICISVKTLGLSEVSSSCSVPFWAFLVVPCFSIWRTVGYVFDWAKFFGCDFVLYK